MGDLGNDRTVLTFISESKLNKTNASLFSLCLAVKLNIVNTFNSYIISCIINSLVEKFTFLYIDNGKAPFYCFKLRHFSK